jgi:hypothetical protein
MDWCHQLGIVDISKHYAWHGHLLISNVLAFFSFYNITLFELSWFDFFVFNSLNVSYNLSCRDSSYNSNIR